MSAVRAGVPRGTPEGDSGTCYSLKHAIRGPHGRTLWLCRNVQAKVSPGGGARPPEGTCYSAGWSPATPLGGATLRLCWDVQAKAPRVRGERADKPAYCILCPGREECAVSVHKKGA
jgi:hypothetical protein